MAENQVQNPAQDKSVEIISNLMPNEASRLKYGFVELDEAKSAELVVKANKKETPWVSYADLAAGVTVTVESQGALVVNDGQPFWALILKASTGEEFQVSAARFNGDKVPENGDSFTITSVNESKKQIYAESI